MPWWVQLLGILGLGAGALATALKMLYNADARGHQWEKCRCSACERKRRVFNNEVWREHDERQRERDRARKAKTRRAEDEQLHIINDVSKFETNPQWKHTGELEEGMVVAWRDMEYLVKTSRTMISGYYLELTNIQSGTDFIVQIAFPIAGVRMWNLRGGFHGKAPWENDNTPPWERG